MKPPQHVIVVGRGVVGLSTAFELVNKGFKVTLVGKKIGPGDGSFAALGVVAVKGQLVPRKPLFAFKMFGWEQCESWLDDISQRTGQNNPVYRGIYEAFEDEAGRAKILDRVFHGEPSPDQPVQLRYARQDPNLLKLSPRALGAYFYEKDMWLDVGALIQTFENFLSKHADVQVVEKLVTTCGWTEEKKPYVAFEKGSESIIGDELVLALGAQLPDLLSRSDLPSLFLHRKWGLSLYYEGLPEAYGAIIFGKKTFIRVKDKAWYGAVDYNLDQAVEEYDRATALLRDQVQKLGLLRQNVESKSRLGIRLYSSDRSPLIGSWSPYSDSRRLFLNAAHYKNAFSFAGPSSRIIANEILGTPPSSEFVSAFSPNRFS